MKSRSIRNYRLENVWRKVDEERLEQIVNFWLGLGILNTSQAYKRAKQVVIMIKNDRDELVGVSTAFHTYFEKLKSYVYAYRCLIQKESRVIGLETKLTIETKSVLEKGLDDFKENKPVGLLAVIQNERLSSVARYAIWPGVNMIYIGKNSAGESMRISYFDDARMT